MLNDSLCPSNFPRVVCRTSRSSRESKKKMSSYLAMCMCSYVLIYIFVTDVVAQIAGHAISELLDFKIFWGSMLPDP